MKTVQFIGIIKTLFFSVIIFYTNVDFINKFIYSLWYTYIFFGTIMFLAGFPIFFLIILFKPYNQYRIYVKNKNDYLLMMNGILS